MIGSTGWALHSVSVWASDFGLTSAQVACDDQSNEITAIPAVLKLVDIRGMIITIDAIGTQKAIASEIIDRGGDYVMALKGRGTGIVDRGTTRPRQADAVHRVERGG